jgi:hypothetical protein
MARLQAKDRHFPHARQIPFEKNGTSGDWDGKAITAV